MKQLLITIAAVVLVGCRESQQLAPQAEAKPEPPAAKEPDISIHDAAKAGDIEAVKQHIAAGTDVNADMIGATPLYVATDNNHLEIVELLIANGADLNANALGGVTPLFAAIENNHLKIAELLISSGADLNAKNSLGYTSLHRAVHGRRKLLVELLIIKGADVNIRSFKFIKKHPDDVAAEIDENGWTPLDLANQYDPESATLLRKHGAKTGEELKAEGK